MGEQPQIHVEGLTRTFRVPVRTPGWAGAVRDLVLPKHRTVTALDRISFSINAGELIGYIGPNGAGKSTTIKILSGILVPDGGTATVLGRTPWQDRIATVRELGVVFGQRTQLWWDLPVIESFELLREIYKVDHGAWKRSLDELVGLLDLGPLLDTPVRQLSLGQRMRCELAASLLHDPKILFLDEPTIGLDPDVKQTVRKLIKDLNARRKVTVVLTTHDMDDIEAVCDRVLAIGHGRIILDGTLADLHARSPNGGKLDDIVAAWYRELAAG